MNQQNLLGRPPIVAGLQPSHTQAKLAYSMRSEFRETTLFARGLCGLSCMYVCPSTSLSGRGLSVKKKLFVSMIISIKFSAHKELWPQGEVVMWLNFFFFFLLRI